MSVFTEEQVDHISSFYSHTSRDRLGGLLSEHLDHLHYLNDILQLNISLLNNVLADHLLNRLLVPLLVYSLNTQFNQVNGIIIVNLSIFSTIYLFEHMTYMYLLQ